MCKLVCLIPLFSVLITGCTSKLENTAKQVSLSQLANETKHLVFFNYSGSDSEFHYFKTSEGKCYKLDLSEWKTPRTWTTDAGIELFVSMREGKLTVPDPKKMSEIFGK
jgi:hypothetical protein